MGHKKAMVPTPMQVLHRAVKDEMNLILHLTEGTKEAEASRTREATMATLLRAKIVEASAKPREGMTKQKKGHRTEIHRQARRGLDVGEVKLRARARPSRHPAASEAGSEGLVKLFRIYGHLPTQGTIIRDIGIKLHLTQNIGVDVVALRGLASSRKGKVHAEGQVR